MTADITPTARVSEGKTWALVCYITNLVGLGIVGLIIAYMKRGQFGGTIWEGHFTFLIRTFWLGTIGILVGLVLTLVVIGILLLWAVGIWFMLRIIVGIVKAVTDQPIVNPQTWLL